MIFNAESQSSITPGLYQESSKTLESLWKWPFFAKISINGIQATQDMAYFIQIGQNIVHFQRNSRVPHNSWKIPGMMEFWNSAFKIKF